MTAGRVLGALLAAALCAWFVLGYVQAHETARAQSILNQPTQLTAAHKRAAAAALSTAGHLNPDSTVDMLRAQLAQRQGRQSEAVGILVDVVRREPDNIAAWVQLASTTRRGALFRLAIVNIGRLDPKIGRG